jgi:hypothetical protein
MNPVSEYIYSCDPDNQEIMFTLHDVFVNNFGLTPKIKFRVPFYYGNSWVVYMNPLKVQGIELCYINANKFEDPTGLLNFKKRTQVAGITITCLEGIPLEAIYEVTDIALNYDKTLKK